MPEPDQTESPPSSLQSFPAGDQQTEQPGGVVGWVKTLLGKKPEEEDSLREALEDYIEELSAQGEDEPANSHERVLLGNLLELRNLTVSDVMVPRADIIAIDASTSPNELLRALAEKQHSRLPVYRDTLDDILGLIHIKDVLEFLADGKPLVLKDLIREAPVVSPAMKVLDLLLFMRQHRQYMVFIVDEYGGIDGLATIGDVVSSIIGELQDERDKSAEIPDMKDEPGGSVIADGRTPVGDFEARFGTVINEEERDMVDTLGGMIFTLIGRVPARGEIIEHDDSNIVFEILDADPRRIMRVRIRKTASATTLQEKTG
jgi:magnesium and cobalt transporter